MADSTTRYAPGWPGIPPRWTSSAKSGAGTALNQHSKVWFTISHGILNEIYFPRVDQACTRDMGFIVTNGEDFFRKKSAIASSRMFPSSPGFLSFNSLTRVIPGATAFIRKCSAIPTAMLFCRKLDWNRC